MKPKLAAHGSLLGICNEPGFVVPRRAHPHRSMKDARPPPSSRFLLHAGGLLFFGVTCFKKKYGRESLTLLGLLTSRRVSGCFGHLEFQASSAAVFQGQQAPQARGGGGGGARGLFLKNRDNPDKGSSEVLGTWPLEGEGESTSTPYWHMTWGLKRGLTYLREGHMAQYLARYPLFVTPPPWCFKLFGLLLS